MTSDAASFGVIVVGIDGSACSIDALRWAAAEPRLRGSRLVLVHSWHVPNLGVPGLAPPVADDEFAAAADLMLDHVIGAAGELGVPADRQITKGHPAHDLIEASPCAELIVVGSHGHGGVAGTLLGSVSQRVAMHAHRPVVIVRHRTEAPAVPAGDQAPT